MTEEEQKEFWRKHTESRRKIDEDFAKLPDKKKEEIREEMRKSHELMRNAKRIK